MKILSYFCILFNKIHWSDQTVNEVGKTYSDLCDFNQKLLSLFSKELNGLLDGTDMLIKENQKEDFIKELPLVTEYCKLVFLHFLLQITRNHKRKKS